MTANSTATPLAAGSVVRVDSFPYRHRVSGVMSAPAIIVPVSWTVRDAIGLLLERKVSSVLAQNDRGEFGIVTERDILRALNALGASGLDETLGKFMQMPLLTVRDDDFVYRAIGRMERLAIRHLGVRDARGAVVGVVTTRNLLRHRATTAIVLGDEIDNASDTAELSRAWARLPGMARDLLAEEIDPRGVAEVISSELCALTRRATVIAEARMLEAGASKPPVPYAMLVLGSAGRGESLLAPDQDNAIVFESGEPGGPEDRWFEALGTHIADILDEVGVPYCKGGVMARNAEWRMSLNRWKETINGWVRRQRPQDLLNVDIFFDGVTVHGDGSLGEALWSHAYDVGHRTPDFLVLLTELARDARPPLTLFGGIRVDRNGRADLKKGGLMPIFTSARVLSLRHDVRVRSTPDRLKGVAQKGIGAPAEFESIVDAHRTILGSILVQQLADSAAGIKLSPRVDVRRLDKRARNELKAALTRVKTIIDIVSEGRF
jgi:DNA polymerase-3 subunit epsilon/CBS domain-containing protein